MRTFLAAVALLLLMVPAGSAIAWTSKVKNVHDGDSFSAPAPDNTLANIRLYGIDAPEARQVFGPQAKKQLAALLARKAVDITVLDTDRYGRSVALVRTPDGRLANEEMVRAGMAWVYEEYCTREEICEALRRAQDEARAQRRGLWTDSSPTPPWQWRRDHRTEEWYAAPLRVVKTIANKIKVIIR